VSAVALPILQPWRTARTWRALLHVVLDPVVALVGFVPIVVLLSLSAGLAVLLPLALPFAWLLFVVAHGLGDLERNRAAALLDVEVDPPHQPLLATTWVRRLRERLGSGSRWREIAYLVVHLPIGAITFAIPVALWSGSVALLLLPAYVTGLPGDSAELGLFDVTKGQGAWAAAVLGLVGLVLVAPWATVGMGALDRSLVRALLGRNRATELEVMVSNLQGSRTAAVDSAEAERRRIERDLHDGAQQRLVALAMDLGMAKERFDTDPEGARELVVGAHEEAKAAIAELRHLVQGFRPAVLDDRGLDAALSAIVARVPVPVSLHVDVAERPPSAVESAAYFIVAEALTNVAKHAAATRATVTIARRADRLVIEVTDDGRGGADVEGGSGLRGLAERARALGGWLQVLSPTGGPTTLLVELPCAS
jgi:signal transduction histidine kinase